MSQTFWQKDTKTPQGKLGKSHNSSILIIGSGLAGTSIAHFLLKQNYKDISIVDCGSENASYFRNAGHILHGASEDYKTMVALQGREKARAIFELSSVFCKEIQNTIKELSLPCDLHVGDYLVVARDAREEQEMVESIDMMKDDGFDFNEIETNVQKYGFAKGVGRKCGLSAQANPAKFRNQLLEHVLSQGINYYNQKIVSIQESQGIAIVNYQDGSQSHHDAIVIAANAYSPLFSDFFKSRKLIDPFKGQIIVSKPMDQEWPRMQFSTDHGYIYGTTTVDNRLLIGGWRNNVPGGEIGSYDLILNPLVEDGLKSFIEKNLLFKDLEWEYSWAGIMGSVQGGLPLIGPTNSPNIYTLAGCTGYGFGWFHGSAKLLVDIILGNTLPAGYGYFNPNR